MSPSSSIIHVSFSKWGPVADRHVFTFGHVCVPECGGGEPAAAGPSSGARGSPCQYLPHLLHCPDAPLLYPWQRAIPGHAHPGSHMCLRGKWDVCVGEAMCGVGLCNGKQRNGDVKLL